MLYERKSFTLPAIGKGVTQAEWNRIFAPELVTEEKEDSPRAEGPKGTGNKR